MRHIFILLMIVWSFSTLAQNKVFEKLINVSDSLENIENYDDAILLWKDNAGLDKNRAGAYVNYLIFCKNFNEQSIHNLNEAQEILLKIPKRDAYETELLVKTYMQYYHYLAGNTTWENAFEKAYEGYQLQDFKQAKSVTKTDYWYDLGYLYNKIGNNYEAVKFYKKSLALYIEQNGEIDSEVALNYNNLAYTYSAIYNSTNAITYYKKAVEVWDKVYQSKPDDNDYLITAYQNLNGQLINYGDLEGAKKVNEKLNTLFFRKYRIQEHQKSSKYFDSRQLLILSNVRTHAALGEYAIAKKYADSLKSESNFKDKNQIDFLISNYTLLADYTYENKNYLETIKLSEFANFLAETHDLSFQKMISNAKLGTTYEKLKAYDKGLRYIQIAEKNIDTTRFNSSKFSIQIIKAKNLEGLHENEKAISTIQKAIEQIVFERTKKYSPIQELNFDLVKDLVSSDFINIFTSSAKSYLKSFHNTKNKEQLAIAERLYSIAGKLFQEYYLKEEFNNSLSYYHLEITQGLLECTLLKGADLEQKIAVLNSIERNASQHLLKEFDKKIKRNTTANVAYLNELSTLKSELEFYKTRPIATEKETVSNKQKITELETGIIELTNKISKTEKNYAVYNTINFNLKDLLTQLANEQQLLKYYVCNDFVYRVLISKSKIEIEKIGDRAILENQINAYVENIKKLQSNTQKEAQNLYAKLIPHLLQKSITIIPDSFINYLPFEALFNQQTKKYLVEDYLVSYDYNLPIWLRNQQADKKTNGQSLAAFSPLYKQKSSNSNRSDFKELKFARMESQNIVRLFAGTLFAQEKATKANFIREKGNFDIFHLSMHSQLFEDDFNKSCLVFSNEEKLYFSDLYGMMIPASMVVLSACDTGNGILKNGEGLMSMSRALTYAGVKSAVVSLWQIPDKETSEIMISFYENLKKGQSKDEALANSKSSFIKNNPMKSHPYYWAGFVLNGDISPLVTPKYWIWILGFTLLIILEVLFFTRKN